jgi:hypothetical protein
LALQRAVGNQAVSRLLDEDQHVHDAGCGHDPTAQRALVDEALHSPIQPLSTPKLKQLESFYQTDLSDIRVHTGPLAQRSAEAIGAKAYTVGADIIVGAGANNDETIGHEYGHAHKNKLGIPESGADNGAGLNVTNPNQNSEREAAADGAAFRAGAQHAPSLTAQRATPSSTTPSAPSAQRLAVQRMDNRDYYDQGQSSRQDYEQDNEQDYQASEPSATSGGGPAPFLLDGTLGREIPDYWMTLDWQEESADVHTAFLPKDNPVYKEIEDYARQSQKKTRYRSQSGENTRMKVVDNELARPDISQEARDKLRRRRKEGKNGGASPPKSKHMKITGIKVYANRELWSRYIQNRAMYEKSLITKQEGGGFGVGSDPADDFHWSLGSRPDLGGAAATRLAPGYDDMVGMLESSRISVENPGEAFLWHSATPAAHQSIARTGFDVTRGNKGTEEDPRYGPLGQGAYFADNTSKAQTYYRCPTCLDYNCNDPSHPEKEMLLSRTMVGKPKEAHLYGGSMRKQDHQHEHRGRTASVVSHGLKNHPEKAGKTGGNEILIKNAAYIYPEIVVYYR